MGKIKKDVMVQLPIGGAVIDNKYGTYWLVISDDIFLAVDLYNRVFVNRNYFHSFWLNVVV